MQLKSPSSKLLVVVALLAPASVTAQHATRISSHSPSLPTRDPHGRASRINEATPRVDVYCPPGALIRDTFVNEAFTTTGPGTCSLVVPFIPIEFTSDQSSALITDSPSPRPASGTSQVAVTSTPNGTVSEAVITPPPSSSSAPIGSDAENGPSDSSGRLMIGTVVGGGAAGIMLAALVGVWWWYRRKDQRNRRGARRDRYREATPSHLPSPSTARRDDLRPGGGQTDQVGDDGLGAGPSMLQDVEKRNATARSIGYEPQPDLREGSDHGAAALAVGVTIFEQVGEGNEHRAGIPRNRHATEYSPDQFGRLEPSNGGSPERPAFGTRRVRREVDAGSVHLPTGRESPADSEWDGTLSTITLPPAYDELPARSESAEVGQAVATVHRGVEECTY
ncbi:hypothetical protein ONZ51_g10700 [Trametes cubensis]|uniref:Mid2 domain-containing protein n=1 Tax=Trametes cubensis TaxID=1111947 RepID=A0AAD7TIY5_9APHY|nr:hypothetical protein ONZ51_g10700 [Trametes cubensis]